jgi:hypothetical protein
MRKVLVTATALACAVTIASGLAVAAAQASPGTRTRTTDTETFRIMTTKAGLRGYSTLATGHFTDGGYTLPGRLNPATMRATARVVFPDGSFYVYEHVTSQHVALPTAHCLVSETIHGSYTLGAGTGAYRHISGSGRYVTGINAVIRRSKGVCGGPTIVFQEITKAIGPARL